MIDIGANLTDEIFSIESNGISDIDTLIVRCVAQGVSGLILTGGDLRSSTDAIKFCREYNSLERINKHISMIESSFAPHISAGLKDIRRDFKLRATVGVHPCHAQEFENVEGVSNKLASLIMENKDIVVAAGECGLDYDRENFCPRDIQHKHFPCQIEMAKAFDLPLFFHNRNTNGDFLKIVQNHIGSITGVVHSYTGSMEEMEAFVKLGFYIGVNGCSLKTEANCSVVRQIPLNRLLIETDAPYCEIRSSHAGHEYLKAALNEPSYRKELSAFREATVAWKRPKYFNALEDFSSYFSLKKGINCMETPPKPYTILQTCTLKGRNDPCRLSEVALAVYEIKKQADMLDGLTFSAFLKLLRSNTKMLFKF